ncbi:hypothetical protein PPYR_09494 [Photinus pyralis]|uniref:Uncharacterized protein n=1 Tax=Photinus pyralis TaxID=7054 RepID=A0A5N4AMG7_PHOPY|nr:hypothetical protein PPYR_09494 [Photinus pyralis]
MTQKYADRLQDEARRLFYNTTITLNNTGIKILQIRLNVLSDMCCCARILKMSRDQSVYFNYETSIRIIDCLRLVDSVINRVYDRNSSYVNSQDLHIVVRSDEHKSNKYAIVRSSL